jgi:hypothetical protein
MRRKRPKATFFPIPPFSAFSSQFPLFNPSCSSASFCSPRSARRPTPALSTSPSRRWRGMLRCCSTPSATPPLRARPSPSAAAAFSSAALLSKRPTALGSNRRTSRGWMRAARMTTTLENVPAGKYKALRLHLGLDEKTNAAPVSQYPPDHPLNPNLCGLHWSWQGGYIFLALEGAFRAKNGATSGFSYHLARSPNRTALTFEGDFDLTADAAADFAFDVPALLCQNAALLSPKTVFPPIRMRAIPSSLRSKPICRPLSRSKPSPAAFPRSRALRR